MLLQKPEFVIDKIALVEGGIKCACATKSPSFNFIAFIPLVTLPIGRISFVSMMIKLPNSVAMPILSLFVNSTFIIQNDGSHSYVEPVDSENLFEFA